MSCFIDIYHRIDFQDFPFFKTRYYTQYICSIQNILLIIKRYEYGYKSIV